ncbi:efflux transporter outer membrane subunit [Govanella unica]|uniref:Efflux transporter outer membrane subunit n=1 Tax=Govanella unica TaxID=2975056 RepID=A0A9X3Z7Q5_9PROT|nr:efflux transporter outer membrane subunit [Govania unica]MDA5194417.1 efflux transporter outer membrane subunit [Govania unica]
MSYKTRLLYCSKMLGRSGAVAGILLTAGCAVGPDFHRPDAPKVEHYTREPLSTTVAVAVPGGAAQQYNSTVALPQEWWTLFGSPALDELVAQAFAHNPTIDSAKAVLRQAQENSAAQFGNYFPTLAGDYSATRQREAVGTISPTLASERPLFTLHTAQLSVSYMPDVFGLNRRTMESLSAQEEMQRFQLQAAYLALASNVVSAAIQEAVLSAEISATENMIETSAHFLKVLNRQADLGFVSPLDVANQEVALAQVQQTLPPLQKQLEQNRNLLAILTGRLPSEGGLERIDLDTLQLPQALPATIPSLLVQHRPDVRAAEAQVHSASANVGVAVASRLPQFSISAIWGGTATQFDKMFADSNKFWSIGGSLTQTIFDFNSLKHRQRAAEAELKDAMAQYRMAVLVAFQNVADAMYALDADAKSFAASVVAETASKKALDLTRVQLDAGDVNILALLTAQTSYQEARISRIQALGERYLDTTAFFLALGGTWE